LSSSKRSISRCPCSSKVSRTSIVCESSAQTDDGIDGLKVNPVSSDEGWGPDIEGPGPGVSSDEEDDGGVDIYAHPIPLIGGDAESNSDMGSS